MANNDYDETREMLECHRALRVHRDLRALVLREARKRASSSANGAYGARGERPVTSAGEK